MPASRNAAKPRRGKRQWSIRLHRWTGFVLMAWFVFEAVTGSYLTIGDDIDRWRAPSRYEHTAGDIGPSAAAKAATATRDGSLTDTVVFPAEGHGVYVVTVKDDEGRRDAVYVDPGSGRVNGSDDPDHGLYRTVLDLHADFNLTTFLGVSTTTIVGWLGIGWLLNLGLGFYVMRRRRRALKPSWAFRSGRRPRAFHLAVHNWTGLLVLGPLLVAVVTGIAFQFPGQADAVTDAAFPGSSVTEPRTATPYSTPSADGRRIALDAVRSSVQQAGLGEIRWITVPLGNPAGVFSVAVDGGGYSPRTGSGRTLDVYADQYTARVLAVSDPVDHSMAVKVADDWIPGLHFGTFASWFSKILWVLIGVATIALGVTALGMRKGRFPWQQKRAVAVEDRDGLDAAPLEPSSEAAEPARVAVPALNERNS